MSKAPKLIANSWLTEQRVDNQNTVGETVTQREFAADCDINIQIKRFQAAGVSPFRPFDPSECKDLSEMHYNLIQAHNSIVDAREAFDALEDRVKQRFSGSPELFLQFMSDLRNNRDEAIDLGLLKPSVKPSELPAEQVPPKGAAKQPKAARKPPEEAVGDDEGVT